MISMDEKIWKIDITVNVGNSAKHYMTDCMTYNDAKRWADEFAKQVENGHWIMTPKVRLNPNAVATIDVIEDIEKVSPASLFG